MRLSPVALSRYRTIALLHYHIITLPHFRTISANHRKGYRSPPHFFPVAIGIQQNVDTPRFTVYKVTLGQFLPKLQRHKILTNWSGIGPQGFFQPSLSA